MGQSLRRRKIARGSTRVRTGWHRSGVQLGKPRWLRLESLEERALLAIDVFPVPLINSDPLGSLVYSTSAAGTIDSAADEDIFSINLDDGQTVTVVVEPEAGLQVEVALLDPGATSLASATAAKVGAEVVLQTVPTSGAGSYGVVVGGAGGTTGGYTVQLILNGAVEDEQHGGAPNDALVAAQAIDPTFVSLGVGNAQRGAVLGSLTSYVVINLGSGVNAAENDSAATLSADGLTLVFASDRPGGVGGSDLYLATRTSTSDPFGAAVILGLGTNGAGNEDGPALSDDGLTLYFSSDREGGFGSNDLYLATRATTSDPFGNVTNLGTGVNGASNENNPAVSADGLTLAFNSNRPGGFGGQDIYLATRGGPTEPFGNATILGREVNSSSADAGPFLSADGLALYFHSNRPEGLGGTDLYVASRGEPFGSFGYAVNLGPEINGPGNDRSPSLSMDGETLLFDSDRAGGEGGQDLYAWIRSGADWYEFTLDAGESTTLVLSSFETSAGGEGLAFQQNHTGYTGTVDTYLREAYPDRSFGTATSLYVDTNEPGVAQALVRFDGIFGSDSNQIASGDKIVSARLELEVFNSGDSMLVHRMLQDWGDTDTWNHFGGNGIQADDVEAASTPEALTGSLITGLLSIDVTASLQAWQQDPAMNSGWVLLPTGMNGVDFYSSEGSVAPRLVVEVAGSLVLYDTEGNRLARGAADAANVSQAIADFVAPETGTYLARVGGGARGDYQLLVTRNATFDIEPNDDLFAEAQDITLTGVVLGSSLTWAFSEDFDADLGGFVIDNAVGSGNGLWHLSDGRQLDGDPNHSPPGSLYYGQNEDDFGNGDYDTGLANGGAVFSPPISLPDGAQLTLEFSYLLETEVELSYDLAEVAVDNGCGFVPILSRLDKNLPATGGLWQLVSADLSEFTGSQVILRFRFETVDSAFNSYEGWYIDDVMITGVPDLYDYYSFQATADDQLTIDTRIPAAGPGQFVNNLNVAVELYDASGLLVASDPSGSLSHTATDTGTYVVRVLAENDTDGEYIMHVAGHSGTLPPFAVTVTDPADGARYFTRPTRMTVDFSDGLLLTTLDASDLTIDGTAALVVMVVDGDTLIFDLPAGLGEGLHAVAIAAGAILDLQGTPLEPFAGTFTIDSTGPRVVGSSIADGATAPAAAPLALSIQLDEPLDETNLDASDVSLIGLTSGLQTPIRFDYDPGTLTLTLEYAPLLEDEFTLTLISGDGAFEDLLGNDLDGSPSFPLPSGDGTPGGDFVVQFAAEIGVAPYPVPLLAKPPLGSLIYDTAASGTIGSDGDLDRFTIDLDDRQTVTVVVGSDASLRTSVELLDPTGRSMAGGEAVVAGTEVVLQTLPTRGAGTYTVVIGGVRGTIGGYTVQLILNGAVEDEQHGGVTNDAQTAAQDINGSFVSLGMGNAQRGAVLGSLTSYVVTNLGLGVNAAENDSAATLSADGLTLLFTSDRPGGAGGSDLYLATRASLSEPFGAVVTLRVGVNTAANEAAPALSADGLTLYFGSDRGGGLGSNDLYMATRASVTDPFGNVTNLGAGVNTAGNENNPAVSVDGLTLAFNSNRPGGIGGQDIYLASRGATSEPFGNVTRLGSEINSGDVDAGPFLSADGLSLYFHSNRPEGLGETDLYVTRRGDPSGPFGYAANLGPEINGPGNDRSPSLSLDGETLLFDSDRPGGEGGQDLYVATSAAVDWYKFTLDEGASTTLVLSSFETSTDSRDVAFQHDREGYTGTVDTYLAERVPDHNFGGSQSLNVDMYAPDITQALVRFDGIFGSDSHQIALEDEILSARLELEVYDPGDPIELHRMLEDWSDTNTWNDFGGNGIQADDAEAASVPEAITGSGVTGTLSIDVTASLKAWQADPATNFGWVLLPTDDGGVDFYSSEGIIPPRLVVEVADFRAQLELYDAAGRQLARGAAGSTNLGEAIHDCVVPESGAYFARVDGLASGAYQLVVTRNAAFDTETNDDLTTAQPLQGTGTVLGYVAAPPPAGSAGAEPVGSNGDGATRRGAAANSATVLNGHLAGDAAPEYAPGRLIVGFADLAEETAKMAAVAAHGGTVITKLPLINAAVIQLADAQADVIKAAAAWLADPAVRYAEPDYLVHTLQTFPNDPSFSELWGMHNIGQTGGTPDADIDAPEAWDVFTGSSTVVVANIDTGIDYNHVDLAANMWTNIAELNGTLGVDDDGNGYVDDIYGIDAAYGDSDPYDGDGHGTHTAGTIGAVGNEGVGIPGVNWDVQLMALKFLDDGGSGYDSGAIECLEYMVNMKTTYGVNVVASNNSWGGGGFSEALRDAIELSNNAGIMFVAAAGNDYLDNDLIPHYPSSYDLDGIIAVTATDHNDNQHYNYGVTSVDLGAPGLAIYSTVPGGGYAVYYGTSMATPHVAGATAMLMAYNPGVTLAEVKAAIMDGSDPIPSLSGMCVSGGRLNLAGALALVPAPGDPSDYYQIEVSAGDRLTIATSTPAGNPAEPYQFVNSLDPAVELYDPTGTLVAADDNSAADGRNALLSHRATLDGSYTVRVIAAVGAGEYVLNVSGNSGALPPFQVTATDPVDGAHLAAVPTHLTVELNDSILLTSLDPSDLMVDGIAAVDVTVVGSNRVVFQLPDGLGEGPHNVAIAAGAILDLQATPVALHVSQFTVDLTAPRVTFSSLQNGVVLNSGTLTYIAVFDEELDASVLDASDVTLVDGTGQFHSPALFEYRPATSRLILQYEDLPEGQFTLTLRSGDGAFEDRVGNDLDGDPLSFPIPPNVSGDGLAGGDFVIGFGVDYVWSAANDFARLAPLGSLMFVSAGNTGLMNGPNDTDDFRFFAEGGQTISAVVTPDDPGATLQVSLVGTGPVFTASAPGQPVVLAPQAIGVGGTYAVRVGGDMATTFRSDVYRNASLEAEVGNSGEGNELSIDGSFLAVGSGRFGVVGTSEPFAVDVDALVFGVQPATGRIIKIDPTTATVLDSFPAPDALAPNHTRIGLSIAEGGSSLLYVNSDVDPTALWRLDPVTGAVLSIETLWGDPIDGVGFSGSDLVVDGFDFETGSLDGEWSTFSSTPEGRIQVTGDFGAANGSSFALLMDRNPDGAYNLNEAIWTVDLSGTSEPTLRFFHAEFDDEEELLPTDFTGSAAGDGVAISDDGVRWHTILNATGISFGIWEAVSVDLAAATTAAGMTLGSDFRIKFQQYDNYPLTTDGRGYDEISITSNQELVFLSHRLTDIHRQEGFSGPNTHGWAVGSSLGGVGGDDVGRQFGFFFDGSIHEYNPLVDTNSYLSTLPAPAPNIEGMAFDGTDLYVSTSTGELYTLDPEDGSVRGTIVVPGGPLFGLGALDPVGGGLLTIPETDQYTLQLGSMVGETIDVIVAGQDDADFSGALLQLLDADGRTVLASASAAPLGVPATNYQLGILGFSVPASGVYTLRLASETEGTYGMVVTRSLAFDSEPNDELTDPLRSLNEIEAAIGFLGGAGGTARLFGVDGIRSEIVEFDPVTGAELRRFGLPEAATGEPDALAFNGSRLFYASGPTFGGGGILYEIEPDAGTVLDADAFNMIGLSGGIDSLAAFGGYVVASDTISGEIFFVDTVTDTVAGGFFAPVAVRGGLAGAGARGSLFGNDFFSGQIFEFDAANGSLMNTFPAPAGASVYGLAYTAGNLYTGHIDGTIHVLDPNSGTTVDTFMTTALLSALGGDDASANAPFFAPIGKVSFDSPQSKASNGMESGAALMYASGTAVAGARTPHPSTFTAYLPEGKSREELAAKLGPAPRRTLSGGGGGLTSLLVIGETEPNDAPATANVVPLGFDTGEDPHVQVTGALGSPLPPVAIVSAEPDGAIPLATPTSLVSGGSIVASAWIGDGAFGSTTGDYDWYAIASVAAGQNITVDIDASDIGSSLDSVVGIYDSVGALLASNDDAGSLDSFLRFTAPAFDDYFVVVRGYGSGFQGDPFDPASGAGAASTGFYNVTVGLDAGDIDFFRVELGAGDILGASADGGAGRISLRDGSGMELIGSSQDVTFVHPAASPLPGGGNAALSWVVDTPGTYYVATSSGIGAYEIELDLFRPALEGTLIGEHQILYLDFDGATIDTSIFGLGGTATLSPLMSFLGNWGLSPADESAVIDAIVAAVEENLASDIRTLGLNGDYDATGTPGQFDLEIFNSRDHADPFGLPNVSRVIVGGTIGELGIDTIGIAESIDVGNFETAETAVVLLDLLSGPAWDPSSLNQYGLDPSATIIDLIGIGVGNIAAHEAGHFFANWHTDQWNAMPNIMDQGGNLDGMVGVGPDRIFGSLDDVDVDLGDDTYVPNEGFSGLQDTLNAIAFGLATGTVDPALVGPAVLEVQLLGEEADGFVLATGIAIEFSELISALSAADPGNYLLLEAGPNSLFEAGGGDDVTIGLVPLFDGNTRVDLTIDVLFAPLALGNYQLTIDGSDTGIVDLQGNPLNSLTGPGGGINDVHEFERSFATQASTDLYQVELAAGQVLTVHTETPLDDPLGRIPNDLNPQLIVLDPAGNPVAVDGDSFDGKNAMIQLTATTTGVYTIQIMAESGMGEYLLVADVAADLPPVGDMNGDGFVDGRDVDAFVAILVQNLYHPAADMDRSGAVNGLDVGPFVAILLRGNAGGNAPSAPSAPAAVATDDMSFATRPLVTALAPASAPMVGISFTVHDEAVTRLAGELDSPHDRWPGPAGTELGGTRFARYDERRKSRRTSPWQEDQQWIARRRWDGIDLVAAERARRDPGQRSTSRA